MGTGVILGETMPKVNNSNHRLLQPVQGRRLFFALIAAIASVIFLTPLAVFLLDVSPRKTSVTILRFSFLIFVASTWNRAGPGLLEESGLYTDGTPLKIWWRGFLMGAIPLALYVIVLTFLDEREFKGIRDQGKFWWAVTKYLPLALVIGFLEDMLFFGFLRTLLGRRLAPAVGIYAISHFLAPSKQHVWQGDSWFSGLEALQEMGHALGVGVGKPVELFGLVLVGATLACLCLKSGNIWAAMGVHGGWYYVRTISRKLGEDLQGQHEWLFGTDRFYDGMLGWVAILSTGLIFWFTWKETKKEPPQE